MPKEKYSSPQMICSVSSCKRHAPANVPICSTHWSCLPPFVLGVMKASTKDGGRRWTLALEWALSYLEMVEEFPA